MNDKERRRRAFYDAIHRVLDEHCTGMDDHDADDCEKCEQMFDQITEAYEKATE